VVKSLGWVRNLDKPAIFFLVLAVVCVAFLAYPIWNYTRFYLALWRFDYTISNVMMNETNTGFDCGVELLIMNPTDYSGFEVRSVLCGVKYIDGNHQIRVQTGPKTSVLVTTNEWDLKIVSQEIDFSVPPSSNRTTSFTFTVNPYGGSANEQENAWGFIGLVKAHPSKVEWLFDCHLILASFLGGYDVQRDLGSTTWLS
jgi:hypothetical protein